MKKALSMVKSAVDLIHKYPAVTGMMASAAVAVLAHFKLHVNAADMTGFLVVVNTLLFAWVHGNVSPVKATGWEVRK